VVEIDESELQKLKYTALRVLARKLGVLVQDDPGHDLLLQRVLSLQVE
jgi:hypothetical protein